MDERQEELDTLSAIYPELVIDAKDQYSATLDLAVSPSKPLFIRFTPSETNEDGTYAQVAGGSIEHDVQLSHLPSLVLQVELPSQYPDDAPPKAKLTTNQDWLPKDKLRELESEVANLWEEYGRCQILFAYIDFLQQAIDTGFDLDQSEQGCLVLPVQAEVALAAFNAATTLSVFNAGTYDCGICLEPKKGSSCHKLERCGDVFCKQCFQDFYNNAITEGDVTSVKCLSPDCGREKQNGRKRKRRSERTLHPRELLAIGIEEGMIRRYVEMKRKKKQETDKSTVYCPRTWCQAPARSAKYPPIPVDLSTYDMAESASEDEGDANHPPVEAPATNPAAVAPDPSDRLCICEKCSLAFCKVCYMGWHGPFARCFPRNPNELSAEEKASYDYIRMNTSPCPTCSSPTQKTHGCNHMQCFQCHTHFCYLCGSWLDGQNPYQHFNKPGTECYQRLWELEEGDEGQRPEDGRGFAGGRGWEQMAIDAAREADEREDAEAEREQVEEVEEDMDEEEFERQVLEEMDFLRRRMAEVEVQQRAQLANANREPAAPAPPPARARRRRRNSNPGQPRNQGGAQAVRNHERNRGGGRRAANRRPPAPPDGMGRGDMDGEDSDDSDDGRLLVLDAGPGRRRIVVGEDHPLF